MAALATVHSKFGKIDILLNFAGVTMPVLTMSKTGELHDLSVFRKILEVNTVGTFNISRHAAKYMKDN
jgi:3-hydroxyacyl-CoA dehydrogenase/3-hydroxy-2-methylbutyryl-CoA dehydrogenase